MFVFIGFLVSVNLFVFSDGFVEGLPPGEGHLLFTVPLLGTPISAESISLAVTQFTRYLTMATIGFPVAFAIAPSDFGVAFKRLGVPEKFAFGIDLTFRFLPSLAADFQTTVDAQRIRGFDWSAGATGFLVACAAARLPVLVPTVVNAIAGAEDTIDAMDLRAFGTGHRSWLRELRYDMRTRAGAARSLALLVVMTVLGFLRIDLEAVRVPVPDRASPAGTASRMPPAAFDPGADGEAAVRRRRFRQVLGVELEIRDQLRAPSRPRSGSARSCGESGSSDG